MRQYLDLLKDIRTNGVFKQDRTGTGTFSVFGRQMRFNLQDGFPLLTTKKLHIKSILHELFWFLNGDTNVKYLKDNGVSIWDEWADENGDLGPIYGKQWRNWAGEDQISNLISRLKTHPDCRRLIVSAWNVAELKDMALMPCHCLFQFYTSPATPEEGEKNRIAGMEPPKLRLSCQLYQRSGDTLLGIPYNIASYAFLLSMIAQCVNMVPYEFVWTGGDTHLYSNHIEQADLQLTRKPRALPKLVLNPVRDIFGYRFEDFKIVGYDPHPSIKAPIAV